MQPLLLVKQTLEVGYDPGALLLQGPNVRFGRVSEMLWHGKAQSDIKQSFSVSLRDTDGERTEIVFAHDEQAGLKVAELRYQPPNALRHGDEIVLYQRMSHNDLDALLKKHPSIRALPNWKRPDDSTLTIRRSRCFLQVSFTRSQHPQARPIPLWDDASWMLATYTTQLLHLPGLRDMPLRLYPSTPSEDFFPGLFHQYAPSIIASWIARRDPRLEALNAILRKLELTWKVDATRIDDTSVSLRVGRLPRAQVGGARDLVNLADVGLGVSQTLPILVALLTARKGQIVYLEQPEIHLHPRAQIALGPILMEAAQRGALIVCETHSHLLLRSIQNVVARARGQTPPVALYWFSRDADGVTRVDKRELDALGTYGDLPIDFDELELKLENSYLDAVQREW